MRLWHATTHYPPACPCTSETRDVQCGDLPVSRHPRQSLLVAVSFTLPAARRPAYSPPSLDGMGGPAAGSSSSAESSWTGHHHAPLAPGPPLLHLRRTLASRSHRSSIAQGQSQAGNRIACHRGASHPNSCPALRSCRGALSRNHRAPQASTKSIVAKVTHSDPHTCSVGYHTCLQLQHMVTV